MGKDASSAASEATISLATPHRTPASPPASSFIDAGESTPSAASGYRWARSQTPSRSGRRAGVFGGAAQTSPERSHSRSREIREAWRTPSPEEVSSELMGPSLQATVSPNMRTPEEQFSAFSFSLKTPGGRELGSRPAKTATTSAASERAAPQPQMDFNYPTFSDRSPDVPDRDSPAPSQSSSASSYAHRLYHRTDTLVRKIKPRQHRDKVPRTARRSTPPLRSPTYGVPKVVADTRDPLHALSGTHSSEKDQTLQAFTAASTTAPIGPLKLPPKALKKIASSASSERESKHKSSDGSTPSKAAVAKVTAVKRPGILRSSASVDISSLPAGQSVQVAELPSPRLAGRDAQAMRTRIATRRKQQHSSSSQTTPMSPTTWAAVIETPASPESGSTLSNPFQSDESYFTSLRVKMVGRQGFTPTLMPAYEAETPAPLEQRLPTSPASAPVLKSPEPVHTSLVKQKRGSIFSMLGKSLHRTTDSPENSGPGHMTPRPGQTPSILPSTDTAPKTPAADGIFLPPYFAVPKRRNNNVEQSSQRLSPLSALSPSSNNTATETVLASPSVPATSDNPLSSFTPLPPLRDNYDRSRRVSIELPGYHGTHRPSDTPFQSADATPASQQRTAQVSGDRATEAIPTSRRALLSLRLLGLKRPLRPMISSHSKRRRIAKTGDITAETSKSIETRRPSADTSPPSKRPQRRQTTLASPKVEEEPDTRPPTPLSMLSSRSSRADVGEEDQETPKWTS